jgi:hypothetical protein
MLDETIITETPPLYSCYGHIGEQVRVPITGNRAKRILHGAINIKSGDVALLITEEWTKETHQTFLAMIRSHWRGWNLVLFEDRASQHKSPESLAYAEQLAIEVRLLPKATPELNARDHLWRHTKQETVGSRATGSTPSNRDEGGKLLKNAGPSSIPPCMVAKPCLRRDNDGPARPILPQPRLHRTRATRTREHPRP